MKFMNLLICATLLALPLACTPQSQSSRSDVVDVPATERVPAETARVRLDVTLKLTGL